MTENVMLMLAAFGMATSLVFLISLHLGSRRDHVGLRLGQLSRPGHGGASQAAMSTFTTRTLPKMGSLLTPSQEEKRSRLRDRLTQAGLYKRHAMAMFLGVKLLLIVAPALFGLAVALMGAMPILHGVLLGALAGIFGTIIPSFWLDHVKNKRQTNIRRALPDALDVVVVCLEGGLSLDGAFARVSQELRTAHPLLAAEMNIVQREIQMGRSTGEALRQMAERFDVEELRGMASVITQAEKFGASVVKALTIFADSLRRKRHQYAEEMAHKAAVKILFPTLLFIFPNIFVVLLAPAAIQIVELFRSMR